MDEELKAKIKECFQRNFPNSFMIICRTSEAVKPKVLYGNHFCGYAALCKRLNKV